MLRSFSITSTTLRHSYRSLSFRGCGLYVLSYSSGQAALSRDQSPPSPPQLAELSSSARVSRNGNSSSTSSSHHSGETSSNTEEVPTAFRYANSVRQMIELIRGSPALQNTITDQSKLIRQIEALADGYQYKKARQVLLAIVKSGTMLKPNVFECASHQLSKNSRWPEVLAVVSLGRRHTGKMTVRLLNWKIRALLELERYTTLNNILDDFNLRPNRRTYHLLILSAIRNRDLSRAREVLQVMEDAGMPVDSTTHSVIAMGYRSLGSDINVENELLHFMPSLISNSPKLAVETLNCLIQMRLDVEDFTGAVRLLSFFNEAETSPISDALHAYQADGLIFVEDLKASRRPDSLPLTLLSPSASTFSVFISCLSTRGYLSGALRIANGMIFLGFKADESTVISLMRGYYAVGDAQSPISIISSMKFGRAVERGFFEELNSNGLVQTSPIDVSHVQVTTAVFNAFIQTMTRFHGIDFLQKSLDFMHRHSMEPDKMTLEIILRSLSKVSRASPRELLRTLNRTVSNGVPATPRHLHIIIAAILKREKRLLMTNERKNYNTGLISTPDPQILEARLMSSSERYDPLGGMELPRRPRPSLQRAARPILQSLQHRGIRSEPASLALRIRHEAVIQRDMAAAKETFQELLRRGMHPTSHHFTALMEGYANQGDTKSASDVMKSAIRFGLKASVVMFTILIVGHAKQSSPDESLRVFQDMVDAGIRPDKAAVDAVTSAFYTVGAYAMAKRVLLTFWTQVHPFPEDISQAGLLELVRTFRSLAYHELSGRKLTKREALELHIKIHGLIDQWKERDFGEGRSPYQAKESRRKHKDSD